MQVSFGTGISQNFLKYTKKNELGDDLIQKIKGSSKEGTLDFIARGIFDPDKREGIYKGDIVLLGRGDPKILASSEQKLLKHCPNVNDLIPVANEIFVDCFNKLAKQINKTAR